MYRLNNSQARQDFVKPIVEQAQVGNRWGEEGQGIQHKISEAYFEELAIHLHSVFQGNGSEILKKSAGDFFKAALNATEESLRKAHEKKTHTELEKDEIHKVFTNMPCNLEVGPKPETSRAYDNDPGRYFDGNTVPINEQVKASKGDSKGWKKETEYVPSVSRHSLPWVPDKRKFTLRSEKLFEVYRTINRLIKYSSKNHTLSQDDWVKMTTDLNAAHEQHKKLLAEEKIAGTGLPTVPKLKQREQIAIMTSPLEEQWVRGPTYIESKDKGDNSATDEKSPFVGRFHRKHGILGLMNLKKKWYEHQTKQWLKDPTNNFANEKRAIQAVTGNHEHFKRYKKSNYVMELADAYMTRRPRKPTEVEETEARGEHIAVTEENKAKWNKILLAKAQYLWQMDREAGKAAERPKQSPGRSLSILNRNAGSRDGSKSPAPGSSKTDTANTPVPASPRLSINIPGSSRPTSRDGTNLPPSSPSQKGSKSPRLGITEKKSSSALSTTSQNSINSVSSLRSSLHFSNFSSPYSTRTNSIMTTSSASLSPDSTRNDYFGLGLQRSGSSYAKRHDSMSSNKSDDRGRSA